MTCFVCHRSLSTRAKKCPLCGAPAALSNGIFLFEMNTADKNQLKKYYDKSRESANDNSARTTQSTPASTTASSSTRSTQSTPASTTTNSSARTTQSTTASTAETGTSRSFSGVNLVKGLILMAIGWMLPIINVFIIGHLRNNTLSFLLIGLSLIYPAWFIYTEMCYSSSIKTTVFWICTAISIISVIAGFVYGNADTKTANATVTAWVGYAEKEGLDIIKYLLQSLSDPDLYVIAQQGANISLIFYTDGLLAWADKKSTFRKILVIIGSVAVVASITYAAYKTGLSLALKREMTNYFAAAFPGQTITF